tara:strand:+ start:645 stop:1217 length:573 start_codon:yes stop_codon:yes gene_type:complete
MCGGIGLKFIPQTIPEVIVVRPNVKEDHRGYFVENFRKDLFEEAIGYKVNFIQDNESKSTKNVLRGLHYQLPPYSQAKLVRVIEGRVLDVSVDIRKSSPTFGQHVAVELTDKNKHQLFIPSGFAHGFVILSDSATFAYKVDNYYAPDYDRGIAFDDKDLAINWKISHEYLQLSNKDKSNPTLASAKDIFE